MVFRKTVPVPHGAALVVNRIRNKESGIRTSNFGYPSRRHSGLDPESRNKNKQKKSFLFSFFCLDPDIRRDDRREGGNDNGGHQNDRQWFRFSTLHDLFERLGYGFGLGRVLPVLLKLYRGAGKVFSCSYVAPGSGTFEKKFLDWPMARISQRLLERFDYVHIRQRMLENYRTIQRLARAARLDFFPREIAGGTVPNEVIFFLPDEAVRNRTADKLMNQGIGVSKMWFWNENLELKNGVPSVEKWVGRGVVVPMHFRLTLQQMEWMFRVLREI